MLPSDVLKYIVGKNNTDTNATTGTGASQAGLADSGTNQWYNQAGLNKNAQDAANPSLSFNFGAGKELDSGQIPDKPGGMTNNFEDATPDTRQTPAPQNVQPRSPAYPTGLTSPAGQSATAQSGIGDYYSQFGVTPGNPSNQPVIDGLPNMSPTGPGVRAWLPTEYQQPLISQPPTLPAGQPATTQSGLGDYYSQFGITPDDPSNKPVIDGLPNMSPTGPGVRAWLPTEYQQPLISQPPTLPAGQSATAQSGQTTAPQYSSGNNYSFGVPYLDSKFGNTSRDPFQSVAGSLPNIPLTDSDFVDWLSKQRLQSSISQPPTSALGQSASPVQPATPQNGLADNFPRFGAISGNPLNPSVAGDLSNLPSTDPDFVDWLSKQRLQSSISQPSTNAAIGNGNASGDAPDGQTPQTNPGINDPKTMEAMNDNGTRSDAGGSNGTDKAKASPPPPESAEIKKRFGAIVPESPNLRTDGGNNPKRGQWKGYQNSWHSISIHTMQQDSSGKFKREKIDDAGWVGYLTAKQESGNNATTISRNGRAYGTFQLLDGELHNFTDTYYQKEFAGLKVGTEDYKKKWKELAKSDPNFVKSEYEFVKKNIYGVFARRLSAGFGLDVEKSSRAVQEIVFSTGVHRGKYNNVISEALAGKDFSKMTDRDFVNYIQDYKLAHNIDTPQRVKDDRADLLDLCNGERLNIHPKIE